MCSTCSSVVISTLHSKLTGSSVIWWRVAKMSLVEYWVCLSFWVYVWPTPERPPQSPQAMSVVAVLHAYAHSTNYTIACPDKIISYKRP
jgi:hypothetical protein